MSKREPFGAQIEIPAKQQQQSTDLAGDPNLLGDDLMWENSKASFTEWWTLKRRAKFKQKDFIRLNMVEKGKIRILISNFASEILSNNGCENWIKGLNLPMEWQIDGNKSKCEYWKRGQQKDMYCIRWGFVIIFYSQVVRRRVWHWLSGIAAESQW